MKKEPTSKNSSHSSGARPSAFAAPACLLLAASVLASVLASPASATAAARASQRRLKTVAAAQTPSKPNIANEVEKDDKKTNGVEKETTKPQATDPKTPKPPRQPRQRPQLEVTFTTDVPEAEIFVNSGGLSRYSLGKTGADGKLTTRLARGPHNVTATRAGHRIQSRQIDVRPGSTAFNFNLTLPTPPPKDETASTDDASATTTTPADAAPTTNEVSSEKVLAEADELIKRYLDAKETEDVTAEQWKEMLAKVNAALEREPDNAPLKGRALVAQGQLLFLGNEYGRALLAFNRAAQESPELAAAHYGRGNAYLYTNQPVEAFKAYQRATEVSPELGLALKGMGDALVKQNRQKEADQYYARAKMTGAAPASISLLSARNLKQRKRWAQALKEFQEIANSQPSPELYIEIGDCYAGLEQPLSASKAYRQATELDPKSALAHYKYGEVMFRDLREYASAVEALELSLSLDLTGASINRKRAREMANKAAEKIRKME